MRHRFAFTCALTFAIHSGSQDARAQDDTAAVVASTTLFREARELLAQGRTVEACGKFSESYRLQNEPGILLNLAQCEEKLGRTASAWVHYGELEMLARRKSQPEREAFAHKKVQELEPLLSKLKIDVATQEQRAAIVLEYDGIRLGQASWSSEIPVDPGEHRLQASAPGYTPFLARLTIAQAGVQRVSVPKLALLPEASPELRPPPPPFGEPAKTSALRTIALPVLIGGLVVTGGGLAFGLVAKLENDKARRNDCGPLTCSMAGVERIDRASTWATWSTATTIVGGALAVTGIVLLIAAPKTPSQLSNALLTQSVSF
jgi:hypothetical protein